jgi:hypothetical protein
MAKADGSAVCTRLSNPFYQQQRLLALMSTLCAPRQSVDAQHLCRLIVSSDLSWSATPTDNGRSWLYLTEPAEVQRFADCLVLTVP